MEDSAQHTDSFKLLRLNMQRLPPASVSWPTLSNSRSRAQKVEFDIVLSLSDDYGSSFTTFEAHQVKLTLVDSTTCQPLFPRLKLYDARPLPDAISNDNDSNGQHVVVTLTGAQGPYYNVKLRLQSNDNSSTPPTQFKLMACVTSRDTQTDVNPFSVESRSVLRLLDKSDRDVFQDWDDRQYVVLDVVSGSIQIKHVKGLSEPTTSSNKLQTASRWLHLVDLPPLIDDDILIDRSEKRQRRRIQVVERLGLNNSTGQRLWDCAIVTSAWLSLETCQLQTASRHSVIEHTEQVDNEKPPRKRMKTSTQTCLLELGAGCGLVSMVAAARFALQSDQYDSNKPVRIVASDVQDTVETTLKETLESNGFCHNLIEQQVVEWDCMSQATRQRVRHQDDCDEREQNLCIIATDVLYNTDSHSILLNTILFLLKPNESMFISYKRRTEGDSNFFNRAQIEGCMKVENIWTWGEVSIWKLQKS
ncbi:hypothetical protein OIO90_002690 [Microbotryomycetes sp. JL221]|nr:hypothetical protein OIO90_002690 [Microbotryomycetes sp. JL221]